MPREFQHLVARAVGATRAYIRAVRKLDATDSEKDQARIKAADNLTDVCFAMAGHGRETAWLWELQQVLSDNLGIRDPSTTVPTLWPIVNAKLQAECDYQANQANKPAARTNTTDGDGTDSTEAGDTTFDGRLRFDETTCTISLDGKSQKVTNPKAFALYRLLATQKGTPKTKAEIKSIDKQFRGDKTIPRLRDALPRTLRNTVRSNNSGYWLLLPSQPQQQIRE